MEALPGLCLMRRLRVVVAAVCRQHLPHCEIVLSSAGVVSPGPKRTACPQRQRHRWRTCKPQRALLPMLRLIRGRERRACLRLAQHRRQRNVCALDSRLRHEQPPSQ